MPVVALSSAVEVVVAVLVVVAHFGSVPFQLSSQTL